MDIHLNTEPVKYAIIALSAPVWLPFARALWREFNDSLRDEGGVFGHAPTAAELAAIERERGRFHTSLLNVTWEEHEREQARGPARYDDPRASSGANAGAAGAPAAREVRRSGFR